MTSPGAYEKSRCVREIKRPLVDFFSGQFLTVDSANADDLPVRVRQKRIMPA